MGRRSWSRAILILCVAWLLSLVSLNHAWAQSDTIEIKQIEIQGNQRIETEAIRARVKTQTGSFLVPDELREDLKAIYEMGYFEDVQIKTEPLTDGIKVTFIVKERPYLVDVQYAGNKEITVDKLKEQVILQTQAFVDDLQIKDNAERIRRYYEQEGYYQTRVIPVLKNVGEDRMSLVYYIEEGGKARIRKLEFEGRQAIPAKTLLQSMETRKYSSLLSWLTSSGYYKKEVLNFDIERIREAYLNNGYLEIQVGVPEVEFHDRRTQVRVPFPVAHGDLDHPYEFREVSANIRIPVVEGEQFRIRRIEVTGNDVLDTSQIISTLNLSEGDLFRRNRLQEGIAAIHDLYGEKGYLFANVIPQFSTHPEDRTVDLVLQTTEHRQIRIRQIRITGNNKTRDKVVRREIRLNEQEVINTKLLRRSFQRINNLNFFDSVEITPHRFGEDQVDLSVQVKEKSTGAMSIGGGYSSVDRFVGLVEITQGNLFGRGQLLRARGQVGGISSTYSLTFREPYLFDRPVSGTVDLFNLERDFNTYQEQRIGGDLVLGKAFTEFVSGSLQYKLEMLEIFDVSDDAPGQIREQEGKSTTSSVRTTLARDTRDFFFDPREGMRTSLSVEYAGTFLGGSNDFVKTILDVSRFFPLFWDTVFSLHGRVGYATGIQSDELPIGERFFVGGINTVRGVDFGEAGPCKNEDEKIVPCIDGDIVGGDKELIFNVEFLFPLIREARIKGVLFFDAGRAFDEEERIRFSQLRTSIGFGMRWISPIGPLRLEWGYLLDREPGEGKGQLEFSIGTLF
jgi:outer membrane protein insertion porin family